MSAIIYTAPLCPYCELAKQVLTERKITFQELGVIFTQVPQIVLNGIHIGGYTDLVSYFKKKDQSNGEPK